MDYKKLIRSRKVRIWILDMLDWVPDKIMVPLQYRIHTGRKLSMKNPTRFTEKLQIYKLKYRNALMLRCTDKYEVRKVVEELGMSNILIPLIGVYNSPTNIDFETLPNEFVAKTTDGGGGNQVFICRDKSTLNKNNFFAALKGWMDAPKGKNPGREWAYENDYPRRIMIEKLLKVANRDDMPDYKFFCFNGRVEMVYGITGRCLGQKVRCGVYTRNFEKLDVHRNDELPQTETIPKPINYNRMIEISEKLASYFPHVRVDLYNVEGRIFFGELTFYDGSGYMSYTPDTFDFDLGAKFDISEFK